MSALTQEEAATWIDEVSAWKNQDNADFYEGISIKSNVTNSVLGGLEEGYDLDLIYSDIANAKSILEVGAGYGRVIRALLNRGYQGEIFAIERCKKLCCKLLEDFNGRICLYNTSLMHLATNQMFDAILWMFSGISDFSRSEQVMALAKLSSFLNEKGLIVIDTFSPILKPANAKDASKQTYLIELEGYKLNGYIPSAREIYAYAGALSLKVIKEINYKTHTGSQRCMYVLVK